MGHTPGAGGSAESSEAARSHSQDTGTQQRRTRRGNGSGLPWAVVLAGAGAEETVGRGGAGSETKALWRLGEQAVVAHVLATVGHVVAAKRTVVVVDEASVAVRDALPVGVHTVVQGARRGTGAAVYRALQAMHELGATGGRANPTVLVVHGDLPLVRPATLRGAWVRHVRTSPLLTLVTAVPDPDRRYGRLLPDASRIIEHTEASAELRASGALNVGVLVASKHTLEDALAVMHEPDGADSEVQLPDVVAQLQSENCSKIKHHRSATKHSAIETYQVLDPDEIHGIDRPEDLAAAHDILQERSLRPGIAETYNQIRFGTGGWRAVIGEGFTMDNVRRLCQALAEHLLAQSVASDGVVVGYDRRLLSEAAANAAAEVFAANNIPVLLLQQPTPTPLLTHATVAHHAALGVMVTASHNPAEYNGFKLFHSDGSFWDQDATDAVAWAANRIGVAGEPGVALGGGDAAHDQARAAAVVRVDQDIATKAQWIRPLDHTAAYLAAVRAQLNIPAMQRAKLRVAVDVMHGSGHATIARLLEEAGCTVTQLHARRDPLFGGRSPEPDGAALQALQEAVRSGDCHLGMATDGDADRIGLVDDSGAPVDTNTLLLLLYHYLCTHRDQCGPVVRNLATTHRLDAMASHFETTCQQTPVGFRYVVAAMQRHNAVLGGESSGGLTLRGHILGKDGVLAAGLLAEMVAVTRLTVREQVAQVTALVGHTVIRERTWPATAHMRLHLPSRLPQLAPVGSHTFAEDGTDTQHQVEQMHQLDGCKWVMNNGSWVLCRFSGTEPLLRLTVEAPSEAEAQALLQRGALALDPPH